MTTLILKDLSRADTLERAASQSVRGGSAPQSLDMHMTQPGGIMPPVLVQPGWGDVPPVHIGCGPTITPYQNPPLQPVHIVPL